MRAQLRLALASVVFATMASSLATGCISNGAPAESDPGPLPKRERLTHAELDEFAIALRRPALDYNYVVYGYDWADKRYRLERGGKFAGYLAPLPSQRLRALADGTFTDGQFNRIGVRRVSVNGEPHDLTIASTPDGTTVVAAAGIGDASGVRFVIIERLRELISVIAEAGALRDLPCIGRAAHAGSTGDLMRCLGATPGQAGGGSSGGGAGDLLGSGGLLEDPDCKRDMFGSVTYRSGMRRTFKDRMDDAGLVRSLADMYRRQADGEPKIDRERAMRDLANAYDLEADLTEELAQAEEDEARVRADPNSTEQQRADAAARTDHVRAKLRSAERDRQEAWERQQRAGRTRTRPAPGEAPPVEDPRCRGREVDSERGTLFTNRDFCGDDDPLTCLRRQQDSIYRFFDGQCWTETGADDARHIVCASEADGSDRPDADGGVEPPECEPQDVDCWTDPVAPRAPRGRTNLRYVDITPMGAFLLGLCARGGCPQPVP